MDENGDAEIWATMRRQYDINRGYDGGDWTLHAQLSDAKFVGGLGSLADLESNTNDGGGLEWDTLVASVYAPYRTAVPTHGCRGMFGRHDHVASLMYNGGWDFDAWYRNDQYGYYQRGDSKAHNPIPEPASAAVFGLGGLLVLAAIRRSARG